MSKVVEITIGEVEGLLEQGKKVKVETLDGEFTEIKKFIHKGVLPTYKVVLENGLSFKGTLNHRCFTSRGWLEVGEFIVDETELLTDSGYSVVKEVSSVGQEEIVDVSVAHPEQCYYGNGILHHNTGKSYLAAQVCAQAQKMGIMPVYFDSESAIDSDFLENAGCDLEVMTYMQATTAEDVLETMESLMSQYPDQQFLFVWDSLSNTPSRKEDMSNFDPQSTVAIIPRVLSVGFKKLTLPIANHRCALLVLQQLKTRIPSNPMEANMVRIDPYIENGGKALQYATSLHIRLTGRKAKAAYVLNDAGFRIGSEVKAKIHKSRFGTQGRECTFQIIWGEQDVRVLNDESLLEAIMPHEAVKQSGAWLEIDGFPKFYASNFAKMLEEKQGFRERVMEIFEEQVIQKFDKKIGNAEDYYSVDKEVEMSDDKDPKGEK